MVVAHKVAIANVIMWDQPVSRVYLFAMFVKVLVPLSCFWHCYRNWYTDSVDFIFHLSFFTCVLFGVPVEVFHNYWSRGEMMLKRTVEGG